MKWNDDGTPNLAPMVTSRLFYRWFLSLTAVAIISKKHLVNSLWVDLAAFAVSIPIALYFENRIVRLRLGLFPFVVAIVLALCAAVLFGI
jgi:hypothetical protein